MVSKFVLSFLILSAVLIFIYYTEPYVKYDMIFGEPVRITKGVVIACAALSAVLAIVYSIMIVRDRIWRRGEERGEEG